MNVLPASKGKAAVDSSPFMPITRGLSAGAGLEKTKELRSMAEFRPTFIDCRGIKPLLTKLRKEGVVSASRRYEPPAAAMSLGATGPFRRRASKREGPGASPSRGSAQ